MPHRHHHRHDVYDDTGRGQAGQEIERYPVPVVRRRQNRPTAEENAVVDPFHDMDGAMRRLQQDVDQAFGGWGLSSMFGNRGLMGSFDRMFDEAANGFSSAIADAQNGQGTYYYESKTRTIGPDGRVHEEHIRTAPDQHGNPETRRTVRDGDSLREMGPFETRPHLPPASSSGAHRPYHEPEVIIEEIDDDDDGIAARRNSRRRPREHHGDVQVEEIVEPRHPSTRDWMRERYRQWRYRN